MTAPARKPVSAETNAEAVAEVRRIMAKGPACLSCGAPCEGLQCARCRATPREAGSRATTRSAPAPAPVEPTPVLGVRRVRLPWSVLVPDNRKYGVINGRMLLTSEYRKAKDDARAVVTRQLAGQPPLTGDVALHAIVYLPRASNRRDVVNMAKLVHDALNGLAYGDDRQIADARWVRAGVDVDAPRCDLTITSLLTSDDLSPTGARPRAED